MCSPPYVEIVVNNEKLARLVVGNLFYHSTWFSVTPFPNDEWAICVRPESKGLVHNIIKDKERYSEY